MSRPMSLLLAAALIVSTAAALPASAQRDVRQKPEVGATQTVAAGSPIWQEYRFAGTTGVVIASAVHANWGSVEVVDMPAGTGLYILREKKLKACRTRLELPNLGTTIWSDCLFDLDNDGKFEKVSYNSGGASKPIDPPVPYRRDTIEMVGDGAPSNAKTVLLYLGGDATSLKLSYREFANGTARPAFTEEFSIPLTAQFPQTVAVKDHVFLIQEINGMGVTYRLVK